MNLLKLLFYFTFLLLVFPLDAQLGIGTTQPHPSAILHIQSSNKGLLLPRLNLSNRMDNTTIPNPANGLLVYNRTAAGSPPNAVLANSFYFRQLNVWQKFSSISEISPLKNSRQFVLASTTPQLFTATQINNLNTNTLYEVPISWAPGEIVVDNPDDIEFQSDNQTLRIKNTGIYRVLSNYSFNAGRAVTTYNSNYTSITFSVMVSKNNGSTWSAVTGAVLPFDNGTSNFIQTIILPRTILRFDANDLVRITVSKPLSSAPNIGEGGTNTGITPKLSGDNTKLWRISRVN